MWPVILAIGSVRIYSFGLFLSIGIIAATYYVWKHARASSLSEEKILDATFLSLVGGLVGARVLYVLSNLSLYGDNLGQVLAFWKGGLSFWGAVLGGLLTIRFLAKRFHYPAGQLLDLAAPALALGSFFGFIGAFLGGSAYGTETSLLLGVRQEGLLGLHYPTQIIEALLQLGIFFLLLRWRSRRFFSGFLALNYLVLYSLERFIVEFWRGDTTRIGFLSQAQVIGLLVGLVAFVLLYLRLARLYGSWRINIKKIWWGP